MAREEVIGKCECGRIIKAIVKDGEIEELVTEKKQVEKPLEGIKWVG